MLPFLIGFVVLAVGAGAAYLTTTKAAPVAVPEPPRDLKREVILAKLIKNGARPSWGLIVPEQWAPQIPAA